MNDQFENQLRRALRPVDAPEGFAERLMQRLPEGRRPVVLALAPKPQPVRRRHWMPAALAASLLAAVFLGQQLASYRFEREEQAAGLAAKQELLQALRFSRTAKEEAAADEKVIELLGKSPYRDKLADAGLFLRTLSEQAKQLPRLIQPHIGDYMAANGQMMRLAELIKQAPPVAPDSLEQIAALQLGARLVVDAWSGRVALDRSPAVPLLSIREKMPFAVTPLMPVIRYAERPDIGAPVRTVGEVRSSN